MGRATVLEHIGDARYRVEIHRDSPRVDVTISTLESEITTLQGLYDSKIAETSTAESEMLSAKAMFENGTRTINNYLLKLAVWEGFKSAQNGRLNQIGWLQEKIDRLKATTTPREAFAWCAWYKTDIPVGAVVATMESIRQGSDFPNHVIYPDGRAPTKDDGQMRDIMSMTPAQCYINYALWPGVVKWMPRYALAKVLENNLNENTALVDYYPENTNGIFRYFDIETVPYSPPCPGGDYHSQYKEGDRVMISMDDAGKSIAGWAEWPRRCEGPKFFSNSIQFRASMYRNEIRITIDSWEFYYDAETHMTSSDVLLMSDISDFISSAMYRESTNKGSYPTDILRAYNGVIGHHSSLVPSCYPPDSFRHWGSLKALYGDLNSRIDDYGEEQYITSDTVEWKEEFFNFPQGDYVDSVWNKNDFIPAQASGYGTPGGTGIINDDYVSYSDNFDYDLLFTFPKSVDVEKTSRLIEIFRNHLNGYPYVYFVRPDLTTFTLDNTRIDLLNSLLEDVGVGFMVIGYDYSMRYYGEDRIIQVAIKIDQTVYDLLIAA